MAVSSTVAATSKAAETKEGKAKEAMSRVMDHMVKGRAKLAILVMEGGSARLLKTNALGHQLQIWAFFLRWRTC